MSKELSSRVFVNNASGNKNTGGQQHTNQDDAQDPQPLPAFSFQPAIGRTSLNGGAVAAAAAQQQLNLVEQIPMMGDINVVAPHPFTSQQRTVGESSSQLSSSRLTQATAGVRKVRGPTQQSSMVMSVPLSAINQRTMDEMAAERASAASSRLGKPTAQKLKSVQRKGTNEGINYRQGRKLSKQDFIQIEQQAPNFAENFEESSTSFIPVKDTRERTSQHFAVVDEQVLMESSHGRRRV